MPLALGSRRAMVFSFPVKVLDDHPLSPTERHVFLLLLCGFPARQIASLRETGLRTVAKQIEAVYRKLGVSSRSELASRYSLGGLGMPRSSRGPKR